MKYTGNMIHTIITLTVLMIIINCASTIEVIDPETAQQIPDGAKRIIVISSTSADSLYQQLYTAAVREGFGIESSNDEKRSFTTQAIDVGWNTNLKMNVSVELNNGRSVAIINGQWVMSEASAGSITKPTLEGAYSAGRITMPTWIDAS